MDTVGTQPELDEFWGAVESAAKSGRGGGYTGKINMGFAWKVFVGKNDGLDDETMAASIFPYDITSDRKTNDANSAKAKGLASKYIVDNNLQKDPYNVFYITLFKDNVIGREVTWKFDKTQYVFPGSEAYSQIIIPHLQKATSEVGEKRFGEWYAHVSWMADPDQKRARNKVDENGAVVIDPVTQEPEKETVLVMYVQDLYKTKDDAMKAAGVSTTESEQVEETAEVTMPDGYDVETWAMTVAEIRDTFVKGTPVAKIARDYDIKVGLVNSVVKDLRKA